MTSDQPDKQSLPEIATTANTQWPAAVVLNLHESGLAIVRSLARRGVRVVGLTADMRAPGAATRYGSVRLCPSSLGQPSDLLEFLVGMAGEFTSPPVIFPTNDADLDFIDRYRVELGRLYVLAVPDSQVLACVSDKAALAGLAERAGVPTPMTRQVSSLAEFEAVAESCVYPAVIKPVDTNDWRGPAFRRKFGPRKGWRVANAPEALEVYARIEAVAPEALIQEWIEGPEDAYFVVGAVMGQSGKLLGAFTGRKRMQYPPGIGLGSVLESTNDESLLEHSRAFLAALEFTGICEIEYKLDSRSGERRLVEINPRHWDQHGLGGYIGVDLSWLYYCELAGLNPGPFVRPGRQATWVRWSGVYGNIKEAVRTLDPSIIKTLSRLVFARKCYSIWQFRDPAPIFRAWKNRLFR